MHKPTELQDKIMEAEAAPSQKKKQVLKWVQRNELPA
jgi:hypothetical protein